MPMGDAEMAAVPQIVEPEELNADEFRALLERRIRRRFSMSLDEFAAAIRAGKFSEDNVATEYAMLVGANPGEE
jgi:hypothetical protein